MISLAFSVQLLALAIITVLYASFDLFNERNVPDILAYASVVVGIAFTLAFNSVVAVYSFAVALAVGGLGYAVYRMGFWGEGDLFALVAISLLLPVQPQPLLVGTAQLGLPFVLSVFIGTGLVAIWVVPIYNLVFKKGGRNEPKVGVSNAFIGGALAIMYAVLLLVVYNFYGLALQNIILILLIAIPSVITAVFEKRITSRMVSRVPLGKLTEGDMIAVNMMSKGEIRRLSRKYAGFGRLVTRRIAKEARGAREEVPVYSGAVPLALFILAGTVVAVLFGNIMLLML